LSLSGLITWYMYIYSCITSLNYAKRVRENTLDLQNDRTIFKRRKIHRHVEHRLPGQRHLHDQRRLGCTYEREIRKKETRKAAMAAVVAVADVNPTCWRRERSAHRCRNVHRGPHERQLLPSGGYPPTGG